MKKLIIILLCNLLLVSSSYAQQVELLEVNAKHSIKNQLKLEFLLSGATPYKTFFLTNPQRFVIDFDHANLSTKAVLSTDNSPFITKIRTAIRGQNHLRLVFDFKEELAPGIDVVKTDSLDNSHFILNIPVGSTLNTILPVLDSKHFSASSPALSEDTIEFKKDTTKTTTEISQNSFFSGWEISGNVSVEELGFFNEALSSQQHQNYISGAIEPEIYREWDGGKQSFTFSPFFRYSQYDNRRTHFDIRELTWLLSEDDWELRVGFRRVFWGVTEGLHLVNIINQTDLIENIDTEEKFGQPMVNLALIQDWGTLDLFVLPGFRERSFPGPQGRLSTVPAVSVGDAEFEHYGFEKQMAYAARWSQVIGDWDIGVSHFYGTSRAPVFKPKFSQSGSVSLIPYYDLINQTGLDLQLTYEDWIFKHEGILRSGQGKTFYAMSTGFEYTLYDLQRTGLDLGLVVEYMYDTRGSGNLLAVFQDDILTALRFGFNDVQSTEILAGVTFDRTSNSKFYNVEASRRIGDNIKVNMELRFFGGAPATDLFYFYRKDNHIRMEISYFY